MNPEQIVNFLITFHNIKDDDIRRTLNNYTPEARLKIAAIATKRAAKTTNALRFITYNTIRHFALNEEAI